MKAAPLSKELYNEAKELGLNEIELRFSGGNDEGYLDVQVSPYSWDDPQEKKSKIYAFQDKVEDWAWTVYGYGGAGDGNEYGDNITYDLEKNKVSTSEWFNEVVEKHFDDEELKFAEEETEE